MFLMLKVECKQSGDLLKSLEELYDARLGRLMKFLAWIAGAD